MSNQSLKLLRYVFVIFFIFIIFQESNCCAIQKSPSVSSPNAPSSQDSFLVPAYGDLRYILHYRPLDNKFLDFCEKAKITFIHWHGPFFGYSGLPDRYSLNSFIMNLRKKVKYVHSKGMKIIFYVGPVFSYGNPKKRTKLFHFYDKGWNNYRYYLGPKPDDPIFWTQRDKEGNPKVYKWRNNQGFYLCPNNPSLRRYIKGILKLINETGADGVFFDGPFFHNGYCFCNVCKNKFRQYIRENFSKSQLKSLFGIKDKIPIPKTNSEALWVEWKRFFVSSLYDFLKDMKNYARKLNPNFIITANYNCNDPYRILNGTAENLELWSKVVDLVFCESSYKSGPYMEEGIKYSNSALYKYLVAASHGKPVALLKTSVEATSPLGEKNLTKLCITEGVANHAVWVFHYLKPKAQMAAIQYNNFLAKYADIYQGAENYSNVALLTSLKQEYLGFKSYPMAISRFLTDSHIAHSMVIDENMTYETLSQYSVLILPEVPIMTDEAIDIIKKYVSAGGGLIVFGNTGLYNQYGRKRNRGLLETFGLHIRFKNSVQKFNSLKRKIAYYPSIRLPMVSREGLSEEQKRKLSNLPALIEWAGSKNLFYGNLPEAVECNLMWKPKDNKLLVHLVNYNVDKGGHINHLENFPIFVRIPEGYQCKGVLLLSPDLEYEIRKLNFKYTIRGSAKYIKLVVPKLIIYDLLVLQMENS